MAKASNKKATQPIKPRIKSPTWADVQELASSIMEEFGDASYTAQQLSGKDFMTLGILASLDRTAEGMNEPIFGQKYI